MIRANYYYYIKKYDKWKNFLEFQQIKMPKI